MLANDHYTSFETIVSVVCRETTQNLGLETGMLFEAKEEFLLENPPSCVQEETEES